MHPYKSLDARVADARDDAVLQVVSAGVPQFNVSVFPSAGQEALVARGQSRCGGKGQGGNCLWLVLDISNAMHKH